jgi:hypothetical protein
MLIIIGPNVPVRIRRRIVQVHVPRTIQEAIVAATANNRKEALGLSIPLVFKQRQS